MTETPPYHRRRLNWQALTSFRFWLVTTLSSAIAALLPMEAAKHWLGAPTPVQYAIFYPIWIVLAILCAIGLLQRDEYLYCPYCGKRVKMGYRTCHHCTHSW
jgi:hypothetical protein